MLDLIDALRVRVYTPTFLVPMRTLRRSKWRILVEFGRVFRNRVNGQRVPQLWVGIRFSQDFTLEFLCYLQLLFFFHALHARGRSSDDSPSPYLHDNAKYVHRKPAFDKMAYINEVVIIFVCVSSSKSAPLLEIVKQNAKSALVANNAGFFFFMVGFHDFLAFFYFVPYRKNML